MSKGDSRYNQDMPARPLMTLYVLRRMVGVSQTELARAIAKSQPDISWYEGEPDRISVEIATRLLEHLRQYRHVQIDSRIRPEDLSRPWDEVLLGLHEASKASV